MNRSLWTDILKLVLSALWIALVSWTFRDRESKPLAPPVAQSAEVRR